jgi:hypothetical protein
MLNRILLFLLIFELTLSPAIYSQTGTSEQIRSNLYLKNTDGTFTIYDGDFTAYGDTYSNDIDNLDAIKLTNFTENLGMTRGTTVLAVERRHTIDLTDTIFFKMWRMRTRSYQLEFITANLNHPGLLGFLEDSYLNTRTPVNLNGNTTADFSINSDPASAAMDRFRIIFTTAARALPITFSSVKAYQQNNNIGVDWKVENELNIKQYDIQKSMNGREFASLSTVGAKRNNAGTVNYQWVDVNPGNGNNFYRIKSVSLDGEILYSAVMKVSVGNVKKDIVIYPNPVLNGKVNLQFINQPKGKYFVRLMNNSGQVIQESEINHNEGSESLTFITNQRMIYGIYNLEITTPAKTHITRKISFQ